MASRPKRLKSRIRDVFLLQGIIAVVLVLIGTVVGSQMLAAGLLRDRIRNESDRMWELVQRDPAKPLPNGFGYQAWFVPAGKQPDAVPPQLRVTSPGFHRDADGSSMIYVGEHAEGRLYLRVEPVFATNLVRWVSIFAATLSLIAIATLSWLGHRRFRRMMAPLERLSHAAERWRPESTAPPGLTESSTIHEPLDEVERLRHALIDMTSRMDAFVRRERDFTRDASHELRTPLTVIRMAGDLLQHEEGLDARGTRAVRRIQEQSQQMEGLIDAFLLLARDPRLPIDVTETSLAEVVESEIEHTRPRLEGKPVAMRLQVNACPVVDAPLRLPGVVLGHLLQNACDFTERGEVAVTIDMDRIEIRDTGVGMDAATLSRVFEPFFRADVATESRGLGLNVVRRLVERMGWTVTLDSKPGVGTTAILRFA
ncbi:sensor histidine kinase [Solilutibacter silvestris]|uniref:histidine kinase n=1 Tax=Solilutibacter silvestris TaxID=1645665 RepID=A0A2K1PXH8_9GAMM|nr:HAMP domain-containing sensor histidine kinase [Lysobacter silvestris]PNS07492.1 Signal transduction histidine kinase [Lysobacter silvestris]